MEHQHKQTKDPAILKRIKEVRYIKQTYYEGGSKATKSIARRIKKQHALNNIHKIRDPTTNKIIYEPEELEKIFVEYYSKLYAQWVKRIKGSF